MQAQSTEIQSNPGTQQTLDPLLRLDEVSAILRRSMCALRRDIKAGRTPERSSTGDASRVRHSSLTEIDNMTPPLPVPGRPVEFERNKKMSPVPGKEDRRHKRNLQMKPYPKPHARSTPNATEVVDSVRGHCPGLFRGQKGAILALLQAHKGAWVACSELAAVALQYSARVKELRDAGYVIENRTRRAAGKVHGAFRLVACPSEEVRP